MLNCWLGEDVYVGEFRNTSHANMETGQYLLLRHLPSLWECKENKWYCYLMDILSDLWKMAINFWLSDTEAPLCRLFKSLTCWAGLFSLHLSLFQLISTSTRRLAEKRRERKNEITSAALNGPWKEWIMNEIETSGKNKLSDFCVCVFLFSWPSFVSTDNQ